MAAALLVTTIVAIRFNGASWHVMLPFIPIVATIWVVAEFLTAVLLFSQFLATGIFSFALFGATFGLNSMLTIAYLVAFPGLFLATSTVQSQQTSVWLWIAWHLTFALAAVAYVWHGRGTSARSDDDGGVYRTLSWSVVAALALGCVIVAIAVSGADALPLLLVAGTFTRAFHLTALGIALLSGAAAIALIVQRRRRSALELWLSVALLGDGLDALLNTFALGRYSEGWYIGKFETSVTASAVLVALIGEIVVLYGRVRVQRRELVRALAAAEEAARLLASDLEARKSAEEALRASDERFRQVEEHAAIGLALVALDGTFTRVSPALCALTGYEKEELCTRTLQALTYPGDLATDLSYLRPLLDGTVAGYERETRYLRKDGAAMWGLLNVSLVRDDAGRPLYFIAQIQDASVRKAAEEEIKVAHVLALAGADAKSRFLATMSHEIRTPMNGIIGMAELLSLSELSREQNEYVKVVRDSGQSLLRVLNDILDYSKIEAGKLDLETVDFELSRQIESVLSLLGPQSATKGVSLSTHIDSPVPAFLRGDPGRIRQILVNLVGNALKFTPASGAVRLRVTVDGRDGEANVVRFTVRDTGPGLAPEIRHRLFKPFSQGDDSTTRRHGGTGLGLSICKQLVDLMGGRIGVDSRLGFGSSFWFAIPLCPGVPVAGEGRAAGRQSGDRRQAMKLRPEKVLLAEDNDVNTLLVTRQFERLGFDVTTVRDGSEAVAAVRREHFDLVFMDCQMPVKDGFEATREIRSLASSGVARIPIVAMTAGAQAADRDACLAAGMDDYISKPATLSDLKTALARWLPAYALDVRSPN